MSSKPSRDRVTYLLIAVIFLMGFEIIYLTLQNRKLKAIIKNPKKNFETLSEAEIVPSFTAQRIDGDSLNLSYSQTGPHTVLFWFAAACPSCEDNIVFWKGIHGEYSFEKLRFLGMYAGDPREAEEFVSERGIEFPVVYANSRHIIESYKVYVLPQTMLIAPGGAVCGIWPGVLGERKESEIIAALEAINP